METEAECYAQAAECERQATDAASDWARVVLLEVARHWRKIGHDLKAREKPTPSI